MKITERVIKEVRLTEDDKNLLWAMAQFAEEVEAVFGRDAEAREIVDRVLDGLSDLETYLYMNTDD